MLPLLLFAMIALPPAGASDDFLADCPFDRGHRIGDDAVVDVLDTFSRDMLFLGAVTERRQARNYSTLVSEMRAVYPRMMPTFLRREIEQRIELLAAGRFSEALDGRRSIYWSSMDLSEVRSYLHYFVAEAQRMLGAVLDAASQLVDAIRVRQRALGIPIDDLERLDGLVTLQRVSEFNRQVDWCYGLSTSPDYTTLSLVQLLTRDETIPIRSLRLAVSHRLYKRYPAVGGAYYGRASSSRTGSPGSQVHTQRVDPELDDFNAHSVSRAQFGAVLCEFAQKLAILGSSSLDGRASADHGRLMDQLRSLVAPEFADRFAEAVLRSAEEDAEQLDTHVTDTYWTVLESAAAASSPTDSADSDRVETAKMLDMFARYLKLEARLRSPERCWMLVREIEPLLTMVRNDRQTRRGVSLDMILELEGRIVFAWLKCLHERVSLAYELSGTENGQQLAAKRALYGGGVSLIPHRN